MNRLLLMVGLLLILIVPQARGSTSQYPNPYRQTMWNNLTDSIHTFGKSPRQATITKSMLHYARAKGRINSINRTRAKAWLKKRHP